MRPIASVTPLAVALALASCGGQSKQDQAQSQVCSARADISKHVDTLKGLTRSTATTSQVKTSLQAIRDDLAKIRDAQGDLKGTRKEQAQQANDAFVSEVKDVASTLVSTTSVEDGKARLSTAMQQLASSYQQAFAKIDCSNS
jgi:hypothetical protein